MCSFKRNRIPVTPVAGIISVICSQSEPCYLIIPLGYSSALTSRFTLHEMTTFKLFSMVVMGTFMLLSIEDIFWDIFSCTCRNSSSLKITCIYVTTFHFPYMIFSMLISIILPKGLDLAVVDSIFFFRL